MLTEGKRPIMRKLRYKGTESGVTEVHIVNFYKKALKLEEDELAEQLARISRRENLRKGQRVVSMGEQMEGLSVLVKGVLRGYVVDESGRDITDCFIFEPVDIIMGCGDFCAPSPVHIEAITPCQVLVMPLAELLPMMGQPGLLAVHNRQLQAALSRHWQLKMLLYQCDAMTRYQWFRKNYPGLEETVSGKHLASFMGMTPVTLSRLRRKLREDE